MPRLAACGALLVLTVVALIAGGCSGERADTAKAAQTTAAVVRDIERQRLRALVKHDLDTAEKLHADDFELIDPLGEPLSKEAYIDSGAAFAYTVWKPISPIRVRVHDDSAVVRYKSDLQIHGSRGHYWHTDLYEKRDGRWQIVWSQATTAP
jgi:hypothetical protein